MNGVNFRTLDLNLLRVFDVVMTERHVTRAADRLAMTQPAVSNAMRRLREAMGEELFVPGPTGVTPTRRAEALWPAVRGAIASLQDAIDPAGFDALRDARDFTIAMADATAAVLMPVLVEHWMQSGVVSTLRAVGLDSRDPRPLLEGGDADVAIGFFPEVTREIVADEGRGPARLDPLYECEYVAVMRPGHALAAGASLALDDYCAALHLRVDFAGRQRGFVDEALARLGRKRRVVVTVEHFATAARLVGRSDLVATLPRSYVLAVDARPPLLWRPLPFELTPIRVAMMWHRRHERDAAQRWLRAALAESGAQVAQQLSAGRA